MRTSARLLFTLAFAIPATLASQAPTSAPASSPATQFDFSIRNIMRGPELYGTPPTDVNWSADSRWIYFNWVAPGSTWRTPPATYRVRAVDGARPEKLTLAQRDSAGPYAAHAVVSADRHYGAIEYGGDIYLMDYRTHTLRRLTHTPARESNPILSSDSKRMYFVRDGNAFSIDLASGLTTQLTDLRTGTAPKDTTAPTTPQR